MTILVDHLHNQASCVLSLVYLLKHMHHTGSQENETVTEPEEPEVVEV